MDIYLTVFIIGLMTLCTSVTHELSSDHLCITCHLDLSIPNSPCVPINKRNFISINRDNFSHDISTYIATQASLSAEHLNEFLRSLICIHASKTQTRAMALLLGHSSQLLQMSYGLYSRSVRPNHVHLTQSQHLNALMQSCQF